MTTENIINICLSCDDNYAEHAGVVIASILYNAQNDDNLNIFILDGGISDKHKEEILSLKSLKNCNINFININSELFINYTKIKTHSYVTIATYYRLKLPSLLPDINKIIYFDCDVVVNTSLRDLFNIDTENCIIAGVLDNKKKMVKKNPTYINAGVLILNLNKMRENNIEEAFLNYANENIEKIKVGDQTIINEVCKGKIKVIDEKWNVQSSNFVNRSSYTDKPKVVHFVSNKKPWHFGSFSYHKNLYFKYLQLTPWKLNEKELKHWTKENQIESIKLYLKHRPFFFLRPRFYKALVRTYIIKN